MYVQPTSCAMNWLKHLRPAVYSCVGSLYRRCRKGWSQKEKQGSLRYAKQSKRRRARSEGGCCVGQSVSSIISSEKWIYSPFVEIDWLLEECSQSITSNAELWKTQRSTPGPLHQKSRSSSTGRWNPERFRSTLRTETCLEISRCVLVLHTGGNCSLPPQLHPNACNA